ncbi:amidohydrolase [Peribacillus simplex]|uniref:6-methylsalicylate decarboxylase n=1 Tax=Peribacillus simplex TaxID=1478 RepID=A0A120GQX8_9BACI|nr:amidohydrolase family protein [Peribacillus simplex]KWW21989.1 amidohydrolase [Peribacillus simplex]
MNYSKIDFHAHYLSPGYKHFLKTQFNDMGDGVKTPEYSIDLTLETMDKTNIDYSVISISSPHINTGEMNSTIELAAEVNNYAAEQQRKYPKQIGFLASLPLPHIEASLATIELALTEQHATGFTLPTNSRGVYLGDPLLDPIMESLNEHHAIVALHPNEPGKYDTKIAGQIPTPIMEFFFDTTRTVLNMLQNGIFVRYPHINFIIPHAGAVLPIIASRVKLAQVLNPDLTDEQVDIMAVMRSQYFDVAGIVLPQQLPVLLDLVDQDKLLYASDTPYTPTKFVISLAEQLEQTGILSDAVKQKMFKTNAYRLLNLE